MKYLSDNEYAIKPDCLAIVRRKRNSQVTHFYIEVIYISYIL